MVRDGLLHIHQHSTGRQLDVRRFPYSSAILRAGALPSARWPEYFERDRMAAPQLFAGHMDVGNTAHRRQEDRQTVPGLQPDSGPLTPRARIQTRIPILAKRQI